MANSGLALLVVGETGVGKELVAREIHRIGERAHGRTGPFVSVDCANLPTGEAALEHHLRVANHGTLFLAGIDELSRPLQARLLHILEDRGSSSRRTTPEIVTPESQDSIPVDLRIVASAPTRDAGELRADLYYRVCECLIELPPLRARGSDVRLLADHFLAKLQTGQQLSAAAYQALERCAWPGNVRELESVIRRAALLHADRSLLGPECLFESPPADNPTDGDLGRLLECHWEQAKEEFARWYWTTVWHAFAGDRRRIVEHARVSDVWLRSRRKLYELHDCEPDRAIERMRGLDGESSSLSDSP